MRVVVARSRLLRLESLLPGEQLPEVDQVPVEVGTIDASELDLAADRRPARAAHAGAIHHDGVERDHGANAERPGHVGARAHHRQGADGHHQIGTVAPHQIVQGLGHEPFAALGAVVGADDELVAEGPQLVLPEHLGPRAEADDAGGTVAGFLESTQLGEDRRDARAAADERDMAHSGDMLLHSQGADEVGDRVARVVVVHHLAGRLPERLDHHGDGPLVGVHVGDGERDALAALVEAKHHEVPRAGGARDIGGEHFPEERLGAEQVASEDRVHALPGIALRLDARAGRGALSSERRAGIAFAAAARPQGLRRAYDLRRFAAIGRT